MIIIEEAVNYKIVKSILKNKILKKATGYNGKIDKSENYLLIKVEGKVAGLFRTHKMTSEILECHIHLLPAYWGKNVALEASKLAFKWVAAYTEFTTCFTMVPVTCKEVLELCKKIGWKVCGMIKEGSIRDEQLTDLILYDYKLDRN